MSKIRTEPKVFKDKNGVVIKAGDLIHRDFLIRMRERPGHKRVAYNSMNGDESIVSDEGALLESKPHWITRRVRWNGAVLQAEREDYSDFQALCSGRAFDKDGREISETTAIQTFYESFKSRAYEIVEEREGEY